MAMPAKTAERIADEGGLEECFSATWTFPLVDGPDEEKPLAHGTEDCESCKGTSDIGEDYLILQISLNYDHRKRDNDGNGQEEAHPLENLYAPRVKGLPVLAVLELIGSTRAGIRIHHRGTGTCEIA